MLRMQETGVGGFQIFHDDDGLMTVRIAAGVIALGAVDRHIGLNVAIEAYLVRVHFLHLGTVRFETSLDDERRG